MRSIVACVLLATVAFSKEPVVEAADLVLAAFREKGDLKPLAAKDDPDPWLVADELCARGEHDAAEAFAKAAARADTDNLPHYVASRRGVPADAAARTKLAEVKAALASGDAGQALASAGDAAPRDVVTARLWQQRGLALRALQRLEESSAAFRAAAEAAEGFGWLAGAYRSYYEAGVSAYQGSDYPAALECFGRGLAMLKDSNDETRVAVMLANTGTTYESLRDYPNALSHLERAAQLMQKTGDRLGAAKCISTVGGIHTLLGDYPKALSCLERALKLMEEMGDRQGIALALGRMGNVHTALGDYSRALSCLEQALTLMEALGNRRDTATTLMNIAKIRHALGDYPKGLSHCERALALSEELGDSYGIATALVNIGVFYDSLGNCPLALSHCERALVVAEKLGDRSVVAFTLQSIGCIHDGVGSYRKALSYHLRALAIQEELGELPEVAITLGNIGVAYASLADYPNAFAYNERALKLKEELQDRLGAAATLESIGTLHFHLGDHAKSLSYLERSLHLREELDDRTGIAASLGNLGTAYAVLRDYERARSCYERSLGIHEELGNRAGVAAMLARIGNIHQARGDNATALQSAERALTMMEELGDRVGMATTLNLVGALHRALGDCTKALSYQERALQMADEIGARESVVTALWDLASTHLADSNATAAIPYARQAVQEAGGLVRGLGEEQGATARGQFSELIAVGVKAGARLNDPKEVAFFLESGRAGTLLEALEGRDALRAAAIPEELRAEEKAARAAESRAAALVRSAVATGELATIKARRAELQAARERVTEAITRIQREAKRAAEVLYPQAKSLEEVRGGLREGEALVLYGLMKEPLALVVEASGARIVALGAGIEDAIDAVRAGDQKADPSGALAKLAGLCVDPLGLGAKTTRVLVSPDGALADVPFALLLPDREVAYVPSGTTCLVLRKDADLKGSGVLALGDPDYGIKREASVVGAHVGGPLKPLPATREEARAVGNVLLLGKDATESGLRATLATRPRWRAVHLACHGLVDTERPMFSSLALTPAGEDDGFLQTLEVFQMSIPANLVVLSACETARGKTYRAEGVMGFTRAFMFAGAPRVLVSLWKVDDEATKALMVKFYEAWGADAGAAAALKKAQEFVRSHEKWKHPAYWAAWQLWGLPE